MFLNVKTKTHMSIHSIICAFAMIFTIPLKEKGVGTRIRFFSGVYFPGIFSCCQYFP